jgi:hypothetical protein
MSRKVGGGEWNHYAGFTSWLVIITLQIQRQSAWCVGCNAGLLTKTILCDWHNKLPTDKCRPGDVIPGVVKV